MEHWILGLARDVWPDTKGQRCWVHKIANILDKLPKRVQPKAKKLLHEARNAATMGMVQTVNRLGAMAKVGRLFFGGTKVIVVGM